METTKNIRLQAVVTSSSVIGQRKRRWEASAGACSGTGDSAKAAADALAANVAWRLQEPVFVAEGGHMWVAVPADGESWLVKYPSGCAYVFWGTRADAIQTVRDCAKQHSA